MLWEFSHRIDEGKHFWLAKDVDYFGKTHVIREDPGK